MIATYGRLAVAVSFALGTLAAQAQTIMLPAIQDSDVATGGDWDTFPMGVQPHILVNFVDATSVVAHIEFDVSSLSPGSVQNATLRLFHDFNSSNGASYDVYRITSPWDESTVTYPTRPSFDDFVYSTMSITDDESAVWRQWDVTSLVQEWVNGAADNFGMAILREPDEEPWPYFRSKDTEESFGRPELVITVPEPTSLALLLLACCVGACRYRQTIGRPVR